MAKTQFLSNGDGTLTVIRCDGTEELIVICEDCGGEAGGGSGIPEPVETDNTGCNVATTIYVEMLQRYRDFIDTIVQAPLIEPAFSLAILSTLNGTGIPQSGYADIRNWAYQVKTLLNPSQIKFYLDDVYSGTELDANVYCVHVSCFSAIPVSVRRENINCIANGIRALKDNPDYNNLLEAMYGFYNSVPLEWYKQAAFNGSVAQNADCSSCAGEVPQGCENITSGTVVTFEWNNSRVSGGVVSCYANGQFSGGVCPNSLLGGNGFQVTFDNPVCVNEVTVSLAGTSNESWERADLYIDDVKVATDLRNPALGGSTKCQSDLVAFPPTFHFTLQNYMSGKTFRIVPAEKAGSNIGFGVYLHCFKLRIGQSGS